MIGIAPARTAVLHAPTRRGLPPYRPDSAASKAVPPFRHGDRVVGTTDPDAPATTKPLPPDPRDPQSGHADYFELARRLQRLAGQEMTILVRHEGAPDNAAPEAIRVPPAFHARYGLRMRMGPVLAVRAASPAAREGVQPRRSNQEPGDILTGIEVTESDGSVLRFVSVLSPQTPPKVTEKVLDPIRLPYELNQWAARRGQGPKTVKLKFDRQKGHREREEVTAQLTWDDQWRFEQSAPSSPNSPQAIDGLGLAYAVMTAVEDVEPGSPAAAAGIQKGDVIKAVQFYKLQDGKPEPIRHEWDDLEPIQWANTDYLVREVVDSRRIGLRVARGDKETFDAVLDGVEDPSWPAADRGLAFEPDTRLQKADNLGAALLMGVRHTGVTITRICQNLMAMIDGRISFPKNASGPFMIANAAYEIAGESLQLFVLFLGMISVNLAVINFLPIPVLDGGHMVFLIYEKLRGRPAPETVRIFATFAGLAMIGSLMLFVIYLDVRRLW
jgi:regulator of sigma E protease